MINLKMEITKPRLIHIMGLAVLLVAGNAFAQESSEYRGTANQQNACMGDVFRLCWQDIPDYQRIVACLKREKRQLSEACGEVFGVQSHSYHTAANHRLKHRHHLAE